ncbi:MAG TPA: hypothetical protein VNN22_03135 [Verrucomicrobiae bacterium]|nr:hypothetical protein [Verrucomicrobiae bacterium]
MKTILLALFAGLVLAGCATAPKTNWAARVGHYTYDQAVLELGPPDKVAKLDNGIIVADWITQSAQTVGPTGPYLIRPGYYGMGPGGYGPTYFPAWYLRLTFGADGKLTGWKKYSQ